MKLLVLTTVAVAALASLTDAALAKHRHHPLRPDAGVTVYGSGPGAYAPQSVYSGGTYVGTDPDPRMRAQLLTDYNRGVDSLGSR
jgi:hypothetical protein